MLNTRWFLAVKRSWVEFIVEHKDLTNDFLTDQVRSLSFRLALFHVSSRILISAKEAKSTTFWRTEKNKRWVLEKRDKELTFCLEMSPCPFVGVMFRVGWRSRVRRQTSSRTEMISAEELEVGVKYQPKPSIRIALIPGRSKCVQLQLIQSILKRDPGYHPMITAMSPVCRTVLCWVRKPRLLSAQIRLTRTHSMGDVGLVKGC